MLYFNLRPNYTRIKNYFPWNATPEQLQEANPDGYQIAIEWWSEEQDNKVFNRFQEISLKYDLAEYGDDMLLLLLLKYKLIEGRIYDLELDYHNRKRAKELAKLVLMARQTPKNKYNKLVLATNSDTAKVTDPDIISWIGQLIIESIEKGQYPISLFGLAARDMYSDRNSRSSEVNIEKLQEASTVRISTVTKVIKESQADLCLFIYKYLVKETEIKQEVNKWFSDKLLNFYFDVLEMFKYVDRLKIESDPKDWVRTFLMNRLKELNTSLSGK